MVIYLWKINSMQGFREKINPLALFFEFTGILIQLGLDSDL